MSEIHCHECGTVNQSGSKFCNNCGAALSADAPITCANCGTENPNHLMYCDNCGNRLAKPSESTEGSDESTRQGFFLPEREIDDEESLAVDNLIDWLAPGAGESQPATTEDTVNDWLSTLEDSDDEGDEDLFDWLQTPAPAAETESMSEDEKAVPVWLMDEEDANSVEEESAPEPDAPAFDDEEDTPALADTPFDDDDADEAVDDDAAEEEAVEEESAPLFMSEDEESSPVEDEVPDWLFADEADAPTSAAGGDEEVVPDWLSPEFDDSDTETSESGNTGWLTEQERVEYTSPMPSETQPLDESVLSGFTDWLTELQDDDPTVDESPPFVGDLPPDALATEADREADATASPEATTEEEAAAEAEDLLDDDLLTPSDTLPDWLLEVAPKGTGILSTPSEVGPDADVSRETPESADDDITDVKNVALPDWLAEMAPLGSDFLSTESLPSEDEPPPDLQVSQTVDAEDTAPADVDEAALWAAFAADKEGDAGDTLIAPSPFADDQAEVDDTLDFDDLGAEDTQIAPSPYAAGSADGTWIAPPAEEESDSLARAELPDWLADAAPDASKTPRPEAADVSYDDMPDWLQPATDEDEDFDSALEAALSVQGSEMVPAVSGEWSDILDDIPPPIDEDEPDLERADIPDWVQALKPDPNAVAQEQEPTAAEISGPLAGVRGALEVEPVIALPRTADAITTATVSQEQQQQAVLLRQLMRADRKPTTIVGQKAIPTMSGWTRLLLIILLLAAIGAGFLLPQLAAPPPALPTGVQDTVLAVSGQQGTVLLVYDYTPALAGELDPQAELFLQQLAASGTNVVTLSQTAAGATLARQQTAAFTDLNVTNLGFLSGANVGLRYINDCLPQLAACSLPFATNLPEESGEIGLIIVLTGDRDNLVGWAEQVAANQPDLPVVAAVTGALAPTARPYHVAGTLNGLLAGLEDAAQYESALPQITSTTVAQIADTQVVTYWIVALTLLLGNLIYLSRGGGTTPSERQQANGRAEADEAE